MAATPIAIKQSAASSADFVNFPYVLYANEPAWRAPLRMERRHQISPKTNPASANMQPCFFEARREGAMVGRICAFINREYDALQGPNTPNKTAFFGYFDCEDDAAVEDALLTAALNWAREQGRAALLGPCMWSVNEEVGVLVDGYEHPNVVMMPFGRPHQKLALERHGFVKAIDLFAYRSDLTDGAPKNRLVNRLCGVAQKDPNITWRSLDRKNFKRDVSMALEIFNDAWSDNWGFIPFSDTQFHHMAKEMRPIMFDEGFQIGFIDGEPAAFIWMIPDVHSAAEGLNGRLLPFGWAKFLFRLKAKRVKMGRIPLMGLKKKYHGGRRGTGLVTQICCASYDGGAAQGFEACELSWILEGNESMKAICDLADAELYKTYRMYERAL